MTVCSYSYDKEKLYTLFVATNGRSVRPCCLLTWVGNKIIAIYFANYILYDIFPCYRMRNVSIDIQYAEKVNGQWELLCDGPVMRLE